MKKLIYILLLCTFALGTLANNSPIDKRKGRQKTVKQIMTTMTEKQMIGQLFMYDSYATWDEMQLKKVYKQIDSNHIGGICFFKGNQTDLIRMNKLYNKRSKIPLFVAIDAEWGLNMRLSDGKNIPMAMTMGALPNDKQNLVKQMGINLAKQCKSLGININFAPDVDININPNNPVINMRSFGENKYKVAQLGYLFFEGMQSQGIMGCAKHFPGHGDTETDSHKATPIITHSKDFIDSVDTYPFRYAIDKGIWSVMMAHLEIGALTLDTQVVSSINKDIVTDYLTKDLGFEGLIFTDAMNMKGLTSRYGKGEAEVMAILAGVDIILMPENIDTAIYAVEQAINEGRISMKLIKEKCKKILNFKYDMGILTEQKSYNIPNKNILYQSDSLSLEIYRHALTSVFQNEKLVNYNNQNDTIILLAVGDSTYSILVDKLSNNFDIVFCQINSKFKQKDYDSLFASLPKNKKTYTLISGGRFAKNTTYYGTPKDCFQILKKINDSIPNNNFLVTFANGYFLKYIDSTFSFDDILVAYEYNDFTQQAVAELLSNNSLPRGVLPVTARKEHVNIIEKEFVENSIDTELYKNLGINTNVINSIDSIAQEGVKQQAYPGCQVLIAKDNQIIFNKNYGYHTYDSLIPVSNNTIYDLASVTKVLGTTIATMKLYEQGKLDLDANVKKYLPEYKRCKFANLTIKELLSHYSTLPATYPFWTKTLKDGELDMSLYDYDVQMDENYIPVTDKLFIKKSHLQTMRKQLKDVKTGKQQYLYSDLNFLLLQYIIESITNKSLDKFLQEEFFAPMNLQHTFFNPLDNGVAIDSIAPTEDDKTFRKQLIHGTVHDPMASLHGGVCGNAGMFSNAQDVYALCYMLLNKGEFEGKRYLQENTINVFNRRYFKNQNVRRGLGFDKPFISSTNTHCSKYASQESFGHSGFTGTYFWIDKKNNTIMIFLSNRVCPSATPNKLATMNIRTDIHDLIYKLND